MDEIGQEGREAYKDIYSQSHDGILERKVEERDAILERADRDQEVFDYMERLDYFAARAMSVTASMWNCKVVAKDAYFVAEAMMEERRKRKKVFEEVLALLCVEE